MVKDFLVTVDVISKTVVIIIYKVNFLQ